MASITRDRWVDQLRTAITVLVIAHHASLSYTTFAKFDALMYVRSTHPVVDERRWLGLDIFQNFNDIFFMSLMFLISGLFQYKSLYRKSNFVFLRDRFRRLLIPFVVGATLLAFITYFPAFYLSRHDTNIAAYIIDFFTAEQWPVGPAWFIWVLFVFNILFLIIWQPFGHLIVRLGCFINSLGGRPALAACILVLITWLSFAPLALKTGPGTWIGWGPFDVQICRVLLYFNYFLIGCCIGTTDFGQEIFSFQSQIVKKWKTWVMLALITYIVIVVLGEQKLLRKLVDSGILKEWIGWMIYFTLFAISCTFSVLAFLTSFRVFVRRQNKILKNLSENAYLIYLLHYSLVVWFQFFFLQVNMHAWLKFLLVFSISLLVSWIAANLLKRIGYVSKYF